MNFDYSLKADQAGTSLEINNLVTRTGQIDVRMDGEAENFISLSEIHLQGGSLRMPQRTFDADSLAISGLDLKMWLDAEGRLSLLDAIPPQNEVESPGEPDPPGTARMANKTGSYRAPRRQR